jgi:hypothetical protein
MDNEWELLDPQIKVVLKNVISSVDKLLIQNKKLEDKMSSLENKIEKNSKISSEILEYLKENRCTYNKYFENIEDKINDLDNKTDLNASFIKDEISDKITDKLSDPSYQFRVNNIKWRNKYDNRGIASLLNPIPPIGTNFVSQPLFSSLFGTLNFDNKSNNETDDKNI